jgi:hypothetical protein
MRAIVPRDVVCYSNAGMGYANAHAVTSVGGTTSLLTAFIRLPVTLAR